MNFRWVFGGNFGGFWEDCGADLGDCWSKKQPKSMPKGLQERKHEHAVFAAPGGSKCMFRGSENTKKTQKIEKKHVQKQRRHAEAHFFVFFVMFSDFGSLLGSHLGAFWEHFGEQNSEGFLVCILGSPRRESRTALRLTPRVVRLVVRHRNI